MIVQRVCSVFILLKIIICVQILVLLGCIKLLQQNGVKEDEKLPINKEYVYKLGLSDLEEIPVDVKQLNINASSNERGIHLSYSRSKYRNQINHLYLNQSCFGLSWDRFTVEKAVDTLMDDKQIKNKVKMTKSKRDQHLLNTASQRQCRFVSLSPITGEGRMGNYMFRVAALIGTAKEHNLVPIISKDNPLGVWFDLPNMYDINLTNTKSVQAADCCRYYKDVNAIDSNFNWVLYGYFQSWRYFNKHKDTVKRALKLKQAYLDNATEFVNRIKLPGYDSVCLHVRRGDMNHILSEIQGYKIADIKYIQNAMEFYKGTFKTVQFIVLSDDIDWCKQNIKQENTFYSPFTDPGSDMALMTLCNHVIVTSGSFGWWGAWLSGGVTVYYAGFPRKRSPVAKQTSPSDYYPPHWIGMT